CSVLRASRPSFSSLCRARGSLRSFPTRRSSDLTVEQVQATQEKLREVSSTTEIAATDMLDGLDRAIGMIDQLDAVVAEGKDEARSEEHTSELQSRENLVCRLLLEKKKNTNQCFD